MNSDDEAYNKYIVTSEEEDKENFLGKQAKTTREQFILMKDSTKGIASDHVFFCWLYAKHVSSIYRRPQ